MIRAFYLAALIALAAPAAMALTQLERSVERELRTYGFTDVDVRDLSPAQLATIQHIATSQGREGGKRAMIKSALGGRESLTGGLRFDF